MEKPKRDLAEADIRLGGISLKEILSQLTEWVENKAQVVPFKGGSETFCQEWDFQVAEQPAHFKIIAEISSIQKS